MKKTLDLTLVRGGGQGTDQETKPSLELVRDFDMLLERSGSPLDQLRSEIVAKRLEGMSNKQVASLLEEHVLSQMWVTEPLAEIVNAALPRLNGV